MTEPPANYHARLIDQGRTIGVSDFYSNDRFEAWKDAHDGIDPLSGRWVEVTPIPEDKQVVKP